MKKSGLKASLKCLVATRVKARAPDIGRPKVFTKSWISIYFSLITNEKIALKLILKIDFLKTLGAVQQRCAKGWRKGWSVRNLDVAGNGRDAWAAWETVSIAIKSIATCDHIFWTEGQFDAGIWPPMPFWARRRDF